MSVDLLVRRLGSAPVIAVAGMCPGAGASTAAAAIAAALEGSVGLADVGSGRPRLVLRGAGRGGDADLPAPARLEPAAAIDQLRRAGARRVVVAGPLRTLARPAHALRARVVLACGACCAPAGAWFADHLRDELAPFHLPPPHPVESQLQAKAERHGLPVLLRGGATPQFASTPAIAGQEGRLAREGRGARATTIVLPGDLTDALARALQRSDPYLLAVVVGDASQMRASAEAQRALAAAKRLVLARPLDVASLVTNPTGGPEPLAPAEALSAARAAAPDLLVVDVVAGL